MHADPVPSVSISQSVTTLALLANESVASADRRPVDPPPVVELRIFDGPSPDNAKDVTFLYNANFFLFATLEHARVMAHGRVQTPAANTPPVLTGMPVSGMAYLDRPQEAGYFLFPDLSVRHEGRYRLTFNLYDQAKRLDIRVCDPVSAAAIVLTIAAAKHPYAALRPARAHLRPAPRQHPLLRRVPVEGLLAGRAPESRPKARLRRRRRDLRTRPDRPDLADPRHCQMFRSDRCPEEQDREADQPLGVGVGSGNQAVGGEEPVQDHYRGRGIAERKGFGGNRRAVVRRGYEEGRGGR